MVCAPLSCTSIETIETIPNIRDAAGQDWNTFLTIVAPATASVTISDENTPTPTWTGNFTNGSVTINNIAGAATGTDKSFGRTVIGNPDYTTYKIQGLKVTFLYSQITLMEVKPNYMQLIIILLLMQQQVLLLWISISTR